VYHDDICCLLPVRNNAAIDTANLPYHQPAVVERQGPCSLNKCFFILTFYNINLHSYILYTHVIRNGPWSTNTRFILCHHFSTRSHAFLAIFLIFQGATHKTELVVVPPPRVSIDTRHFPRGLPLANPSAFANRKDSRLGSSDQGWRLGNGTSRGRSRSAENGRGWCGRLGDSGRSRSAENGRGWCGRLGDCVSKFDHWGVGVVAIILASNTTNAFSKASRYFVSRAATLEAKHGALALVIRLAVSLTTVTRSIGGAHA
jgi:hypothetical protein